MGEPTQGSTAWYKDAADKLKAFSEEAQAFRDGDTSAFSGDEQTVEAPEVAAPQRKSPYVDPDVAAGYGID